MSNNNLSGLINEFICGINIYSLVNNSFCGPFPDCLEYLADDDSHALEITRNLVSRLNWKTRCNFPKRKNFREPAYSINEIPGIVPEDFMRGYDIKEVIARITDNSDFMEIKPKYGLTMICIQAEIEGYSVGILGNIDRVEDRRTTDVYVDFD